MCFSTKVVAEPRTIRIAAIDWCPQICPQQDDEGYIIDIVREIFEAGPYRLEIEIYPWSRAIQYVRAGKAHALLSPAKAEAPDLVFPEQEVGRQRMCFFVLKDSHWKFDGTASLEGHLTGVASDTSVEELNQFINDRGDLFFRQPYSDEYIEDSVNMLYAGRINSFLFTYNTTLHAMRAMGVEEDIRSAGCVSDAKIYMAFSPLPGLAPEVREMTAFFDKAMTKFKAAGRCAEIMDRYGLADWSAPEDGSGSYTNRD
ncbi:substrate-binding periplasmic protein [Roseibium sp.]|uniref:substrate-binding periplasmic protein n=1 Tax=Roseibium sp. TaxID=1936156 RepID=UPI003D141E1D